MYQFDSLMYNSGMANEPETRSIGTGNNPQFSQEGRLKAFRAALDKTASGKTIITRVLPGYLFRDGIERSQRFTQDSIFAEMDRHLKSGWINLDEDLLKHHAETYKSGIEVRDQLLERIRPVKILEMVRELWGKGEIEEKGEKARVVYGYDTVEKETSGGSHLERVTHHPVDGGGHSYKQVWFSGETGMWIASHVAIDQVVAVNFGNAKHPIFDNLLGSRKNPYLGSQVSNGELREFFGDYYWLNGYETSHVEFPYIPLPREIWYRPDNLGINVTVPDSVVQHEGRNTGKAYYRSGFGAMMWFDQSVSQQEIMDYLSEKLEAQRKVGELPCQLEQFELAKKEELLRRGLFKEGRSAYARYLSKSEFEEGSLHAIDRLDHAIDPRTDF